MIYTKKDILARAWLVREMVNIVLEEHDQSVKRVFLIGSYARNEQTEWSDLDFLVELNGKSLYPTWDQIREIHKRLDNRRIHVIFGTEEAQKSLCTKYRKFEYKEIHLEGFNVANSHSPVA